MNPTGWLVPCGIDVVKIDYKTRRKALSRRMK
jgi:hypothetical protein